MHLTSQDFEEGKAIPSQFTCDGEGMSPQLAWSGAPVDTKSFALYCFDPDAPRGGFAHWLVANIPPAVNEIPQNGSLPAGCVSVPNDSGDAPYCPPCPPAGIHRYFFTVYALDTPSLSGLMRENFLTMVESHSLDSATLMGRYQRH